MFTTAVHVPPRTKKDRPVESWDFDLSSGLESLFSAGSPSWDLGLYIVVREASKSSVAIIPF
jgi:hypothetical protein